MDGAIDSSSHPPLLNHDLFVAQGQTHYSKANLGGAITWFPFRVSFRPRSRATQGRWIAVLARAPSLAKTIIATGQDKALERLRE